MDVFRGLAIVGMVFVNHPGPAGAAFQPFAHSEWNGWTLADTIFPAFLFIVGISMVLASHGRRERSTSFFSSDLAHALRRAVLLYVIGLALTNFPYYELHKLRITGTLEKIAVCYLLAWLAYRYLALRGIVALVVIILLGYWTLLMFVEVPGYGAGNLSMEGNLTRHVDRVVLGLHSESYYSGGYDIGGILSTVSSIATTLGGVLAGMWLKSGRPRHEITIGMFTAGFALYLLSGVWDHFLPINKPLWTGSFVVLMAGLSLMTFAFIDTITRVHRIRDLARPLEIAGVNALAFYVGAQGFNRLLVYWRFRDENGAVIRAQEIVYQYVFASWFPSPLSVLLYSLAYLGICYAVILWMYRQRYFIKL